MQDERQQAENAAQAVTESLRKLALAEGLLAVAASAVDGTEAQAAREVAAAREDLAACQARLVDREQEVEQLRGTLDGLHHLLRRYRSS